MPIEKWVAMTGEPAIARARTGREGHEAALKLLLRLILDLSPSLNIDLNQGF